MAGGYRYPRFFAHRTGGALAPENTLVGLEIAARLGFRAVEFDVTLTADGIPVLMHDETLERTTNGHGCVARMPLAAVLHLDAGAKHHRAFTGTRIPRLDDVLARCADLNVAANIELKPAQGFEYETGRLVAALVTALADDVLESVQPLLSSFSEMALEAASEAAAELPRALLVDSVPADVLQRLRRLACIGLHCASRDLTPEIAEVLLAAGVPYACYTVNRVDEATRLFALGASAVFTDRLDLFDPGDPAPGRLPYR